MTGVATDFAATLHGSATVPAPLIGCWDRRYLRFADGREDTTSHVIWLQTASGVADIRIAATRPDLRGRDGLEACSREELLALAEQDCFCGVTFFDPHAQPHPTACWPPEEDVFRFQPVVTFPEPGWLTLQEGGARMIERAPSGAYEEDWRLRPCSQSFAAHLSRRVGLVTTCLYLAGDHAVWARSRSVEIAETKHLIDLSRDFSFDRARLRALLDCEFSYARRAQPGGDYVVEMSTLPWREGRTIACAWAEALAGSHSEVRDPRTGEVWTLESPWRP